MNVLAIETSSPVLSIAVKKGNGSVCEAMANALLTHTENLIPLTDRLLKKEKLSFQDIDLLLIDRGPGSFTGLRIGFATLKGFLALKKIPCYGALSLDLVAARIARHPEGSWLAVLLDAHREKIYVRFYQHNRQRWLPQGKLDVLSLQKFVKKIPPKIFVAGDALFRYKKDLESLTENGAPRASPGSSPPASWRAGAQADKKILLLPETQWYPRASTLVTGFERQRSIFTRLEKETDLLPLYFRLSEAEEKKKLRRTSPFIGCGVEPHGHSRWHLS